MPVSMMFILYGKDVFVNILNVLFFFSFNKNGIIHIKRFIDAILIKKMVVFILRFK